MRRSVVAVLVTTALALATLSPQAARGADSPRIELSFNPGWKFVKQDEPRAKEASFDDSSWAAVSCPHTYNDVDTFDDFSLPNHRGEQNQFGGRTWNRKTFTAPDSWKGKKIYIEFEAVRQVAEVYLNGELLGVSKTGFTPFAFDLTPHLKLGAANAIAVMADNRFMKDPMTRGDASSTRGSDAPGATTLNIAPQPTTRLADISEKVNQQIPEELDKLQADQIPWNNPHWHPAHGGIYRNVKLHILDPLHVSLPLYSFLQTAGPYVYATDVSERSATINLELPIQNDREQAAQVQVEARVLDRNGKQVAELRAPEGDVTIGNGK